jgi:hypothetical protein
MYPCSTFKACLDNACQTKEEIMDMEHLMNGSRVMGASEHPEEKRVDSSLFVNIIL